MGLFDRVRTNYRLPDINVSESLIIKFTPDLNSKLSYGTEFQTKDFDCTLDDYLITSFGKLLLQDVDGNLDTEYHGMLNFYTSIGMLDGKRYFIEYDVKFTDGKLVNAIGHCQSIY